MPKFTKEDKDIIKEKLDYIGIDLQNIPEIIENPIPMEIKETIEKENKVYKYIPIDKIQIWVTSENRNSTLKEKIAKALPLREFLEPSQDEQMENYANFIRMLNLSSEEEMEEIEEMQKQFAEEIPFEVKYENSFLWQIYYSEANDLYDMIVPADNPEYNEMFYIIKKQIEAEKSGKAEEIYVPVSNLKFRSDLLNRQEMNDIEKYLWLFAKEWPTIYEIYNRNSEASIQIVGETFCYEKIKSNYKNVLYNKEEANDFYRTVKALFILQTETNYYEFKTGINNQGEIIFFYKQNQMRYNNLPSFIREEYVNFCNLLNKEQEDKRELRATLRELKCLTNKLEKEYLLKQREIATYLQYKKSFIGRIRLFLKPKINLKEIVETKQENEKHEEEKESIPILKIKTEKSNYTIEDLIEIFNLYKKENNIIKNLNLDIEALENKNHSLKRKNENASLYINEINEHKKSIFEFWKFTNKDEQLALEEGNNTENITHKLKKTFEYEQDIEELGIQLDKIQRNNLSKEEQDAIFLADTELLPKINLIKNGKAEEIQKDLSLLKQKLLSEKEENHLEDFDIFGGLTEDRARIKKLADKKHREIEKNKIQILKINESTSIQDIEETLKLKEKELNEALKKIYAPVDLDLYKLVDKNFDISSNEYLVLNMDEVETVEDSYEPEFKLIKIRMKENMPVVFFTNIIYYNNKNNTLPIGMNLGTKALIDTSQFKFTLKENKTIIRINDMQEMQHITIEEYDVEKI